ncbi:hypothetical protein T10_9898 [Trichinella papuae]|uniref:Uncharacterized protein n=1 Tax=Trichinella papuae TaxID=268474 RepID=A0A0V1MJH1_9BILA|nr:hypothetical protein T10_9898 [Trichinella papuae]
MKLRIFNRHYLALEIVVNGILPFILHYRITVVRTYSETCQSGHLDNLGSCLNWVVFLGGKGRNSSFCIFQYTVVQVSNLIILKCCRECLAIFFFVRNCTSAPVSTNRKHGYNELSLEDKVRPETSKVISSEVSSIQRTSHEHSEGEIRNNAAVYE